MGANEVSIIELYNLESPMATEFRRLLHVLQHPASGRELKTILLTSAMLSEGKSTASAFLALTAANKGIKTLLIDADLRRPSIHKLFSLHRVPGLAQILAEGNGPRNVIKKTALDKLDIVTAGKIVSHPSEVFDAAAIGRILTEMKFYYDFIVVDSAPVIPVSDPMLLAAEVDGILLVVKAGATQRQVILRAKEILLSNTNKLLGVVLNNAEGRLPYYFDHNYYGYDYAQRPQSQTKSGKRSGGSEDDKKSGKVDRKTDPKPGNTVSQ